MIVKQRPDHAIEVWAISFSWAIVILSWAATAPHSLGDNARPTESNGVQTLTFCHGVDGYAGVVDSEIWQLAPATILFSNPQATCDENNGGGESQVLMRFDAIIGSGEHQIPPGSTIVSARLQVSAFDQGDTVHLHRMLVPFGTAPTWNKMLSGVSADDLEAQRAKESFTFGKISASASYVPFDVTDTVQSWVNGAANYGWVFLNTGGNGWDFYTSDFEKPMQRPKLVVKFIPPARKLAESAT